MLFEKELLAAPDTSELSTTKKRKCFKSEGGTIYGTYFRRDPPFAGKTSFLSCADPFAPDEDGKITKISLRG